MSDSDGSSVSSTYHSDDGKVVSFLSKSYDFSSSSSEENEGMSPFSSDVITEKDYSKILSVMRRVEEKADDRLYPLALLAHMRDNYFHVAERVLEEVQDGIGFIYASGVLPSRIKMQLDPPKRVLYDVVLFSLSRPTMVITFTQRGMSSRATHYNSQVSKSFMSVMKKTTEIDVSVIHGVVDEHLCKDRYAFKTRLSEIETTVRIMSITRLSHIPTESFETVIRHFIDLPTGMEEVDAHRQRENHERRRKSGSLTQELKAPKTEQGHLWKRRTIGKTEIVSRTMSDRQSVKIKSRGSKLTGLLPETATKSVKQKRYESEDQSTSDIHEAPNTILHMRCLDGNKDYIYLLLTCDADIEQRDQYGMTPASNAGWKGHKDIVKVLVAKGCDLSAVNNSGNNILHVACLQGNVYLIEYLLTKVVHIESRGQYGRTAVMAAAQNGHREAVELLARKGCNLKAVDVNGDNVLHVACLGGSVYMVEYILSKQTFDINRKNLQGRTAVMYAAVKGHKAVVELLENHECNLSHVDVSGNNILHIACLGGSVDMIQYILVKKIVDVNEKDLCGRTAVMKAAGKGHARVVAFLHTIGSQMSEVDNIGDNILHITCLGGSIDTAEYLLSNKIVNIEARGYVGGTAVMAAAEKGHKGVVELLQSKGCDMSALDDYDANILHMACMGGNVHLLEYLLEQDVADMNKVNKFGNTPVKLAL